MRSQLLEGLAMPSRCWTAPEMLDALALRDVGQLFRQVQKVTGASQTQIGLVTGLSQAQVSEIMARKRQVATIDVLARIVRGLGIPDPARTVLLMGDRGYASVVSDCAAEPAAQSHSRDSRQSLRPPTSDQFVDVTAIYATRSEFAARMPSHVLFDAAHDLRVAGLSLNLLCQQYADNCLLRLVSGGTHLRCLFLDPDGEAIRRREQEEGYRPGYLVSLTQLNIENLFRRVRDRLTDDARDNIEVAVYDETIRFNIILVDDKLCVVQPYLPEARGVDAPTIVMHRRQVAGTVDLYPVFEQVFNSLWGRGRRYDRSS